MISKIIINRRITSCMSLLFILSPPSFCFKKSGSTQQLNVPKIILAYQTNLVKATKISKKNFLYTKTTTKPIFLLRQKIAILTHFYHKNPFLLFSKKSYILQKLINKQKNQSQFLTNFCWTLKHTFVIMNT